MRGTRLTDSLGRSRDCDPSRGSRRGIQAAAGVLLATLALVGCGVTSTPAGPGQGGATVPTATTPTATTPTATTPTATTPSTTTPAETSTTPAPSTTTTTDTTTAPSSTKPASGSETEKTTPTLKLGSKGKAVRALQDRLASLTYLPESAVDGVFSMRTWHAVVAFQGWSGLARDGVVGPLTRKALTSATVPRPWSSTTGIEIHLDEQVLLMIDHGRVIRTIHVSTGRPGLDTPSGHFTIYSRQVKSWSAPFQVWMPLAQYFYGGYAMHEYPDVPAYAASHGCVRLPAEEAQTVWDFGKLGMRVWIGA